MGINISMSANKWRWFLFTVIFGMMPIFLRLLISPFVDGDRVIQNLTAGDFIAFGIVLQVSMFNEVKYVGREDLLWRQLFLGFCALFMAMFSALYVMALISEVTEIVNIKSILWASMFLDFVSFLLCWAVYDRLDAARLGADAKEAP